VVKSLKFSGAFAEIYNRPFMTFAPDDIEIKEFVPTMRGYDRTEVRAFLRAVAEDVRRLEDRLTERAMIALKAETVPVPVVPVDPPTSSRLEDAIRDLTVAVQRLSTREIAPLGMPEMSNERTETSTRIEAPRHRTESTTARLAGLPTPETVSEIADHFVFAETVTADSRREPKPTLTTKVTSPEIRKSTWDGVERRSARRPWSGSSAGSPSTASDSDGQTNSGNSRAEKKPKHVPQHARSSQNQSLISTFLNQALDHRAKAISSTDAPLDDLVRKHLPEVTEFAPAAKLSAKLPTERPAKLPTNEPEADVPTNVVPLMRAV
jgi:DivIVA domain-containing protein